MRRDELEVHLEREHAGAFAWALRCCRGERDAAEDALHAAYVRILEGRAHFEERSRFRTWLFGVIRRTALEERRRSWLRLTRLERWFGRGLGRQTGEGEAEGGPMGAMMARETADRLRAALDRLSGRQRAMMHLVFYEELTVQEAADVLGVPVGTARTHYERGKARLRGLLAGKDLR